MYICVTLPVNEPYQTLVSLCQSVLCGYDNVTSLGGMWVGVPDMLHSFGCEATDWLRGIWSSCKKFCTGVSVVILDAASVVQILKGVGSSTIQ